MEEDEEDRAARLRAAVTFQRMRDANSSLYISPKPVRSSLHVLFHTVLVPF